MRRSTQIMALVLLVVLALPGIFLGIFLHPWLFLLLLLVIFAPLALLRPAGET